MFPFRVQFCGFCKCLPVVGKVTPACCMWKGNEKAELQRQRMEAKLHAHHRQKGGASPPANSQATSDHTRVLSDLYAQGPVFEHRQTAVGYCLCSGEMMLAENLYVKRNFGEAASFHLILFAAILPVDIH